MYVWPSVYPCSHVPARLPYWMDFREIWYWGLWWKPAEMLTVWLKSDKNIRQFTWRPKYILLLPMTSIRLIFIFVQHSVLYCLQWHLAKQDTHNVLLRFSCNNDYANAPQCYVIRTEHRVSFWSAIWPHFFVFFSLSVYLGLLLGPSHGFLRAVDFLFVHV